MKSNLRSFLVLLAILIGSAYFAPAIVAQQQRPSPPQQRPSPPPSEVTPPQTPSETPVTGEQGYTRQNGTNTTPAIAPETYASEGHILSWGSLIFGLLFGFFMGYLVGRQKTTPEQAEIRRDHAA